MEKNKCKKSTAFPEGAKDFIRSEYSKAWDSARMIDFCCGEISRAAWLPNGMLFVWKKPKIETSFCFGYSDSRYDTEDYDRANRMAEHAGNSEEYFKSENLKDFNAVIEAFNGNGEGYYRNRRPYVRRESYISVGDLNLCSVSWYRPWELEELHDGERERLREASDAELEIIIAGYKEEREAFEKRLNAYLKRYGMSKVRSWSYWRDE